MASVPSSLSLTDIPASSAVTSAPHRANYSAIQTAVNALVTILSSGTAGQVLRATDGSTVAWGAPGTVYRANGTVTVVDTVVETTLLTQAIPGNTIGASGIVKMRLFGDYANSTGGSEVHRLKITFGGVTIIDFSRSTSQVQSLLRQPFMVDFTLANLGVTNSQFGGGQFVQASQTGVSGGDFAAGIGNISATSPVVPLGTTLTTIDTTVSQTLTVTVTHGSASPTISTRRHFWLIEVL